MIRYVVLILGLLSPFLAQYLYVLVYSTLTQASTNRNEDWLFRLSMSSLAMAAPFLVTVLVAWLSWRQQQPEETNTRSAKRRQQRSQPKAAAGSWPVKVGLVLAALSLLFLWKPISDGTARWKQVRNMAKHDVPAPAFDTLDLDGKPQRLADHRGQVVVVNIWATWCGPCRAEMPALNRMYEQYKGQGLAVFGISTEDADLQRQFRQFVPVSYPLLTTSGEVPSLYRDIARYPATFLIDRHGNLQPAPGPDQPFSDLQAEVEKLLKEGA